MDDFCGSEFWNTSRTWNTADPDLTICFEKTVLVWAPCVFLWVLCPQEIYYMKSSKHRNIPWNFLNVSKLGITLLLLLLSSADIGNALYKNSLDIDVFLVDYVSPAIKILTFGLAGALVYFSRTRGLRTSGILSLFWFILLLCGVPQYRTELRNEYPDIQYPPYLFYSYMVYLPLVLAMFLLNCFADAEPKFTSYPKIENASPELSASFLSKILFVWFDPLAWKGYRQPLENKDLWALNPLDFAREIVPRFDKYRQTDSKKPDVNISNGAGPNASFKKSTEKVFVSSGSKQKTTSILLALWKAFGSTFMFGALLRLMRDLLVFVSPQLLRLLITNVEQKDFLWKGIMYSILLAANAMVQSLLNAQYYIRMNVVGLRVRTAVTAAIYRKALRLSSSARKESTVGEIVNLMSVDTFRLKDSVDYLNFLWSDSLQILVALAFLWQTIGPACLAGLAVMVIMVPLNGVVVNKMKNMNLKQLKYKDERVNLMTEVLSGIKVLKLYAWEPSFEEQIQKVRTKEVQVLKKTVILDALFSFFWSSAPFLTTICSFATFVLMDENNKLTPEITFVSIALFNIMRVPMNFLPFVLTIVIKGTVALKRINKYMNYDELDPNSVSHDKNEGVSVSVETGTFSWGVEESPTLKNINIRIKSGDLVAVVGSVGSGKTSLLSALLGEMNRITGKVNTDGSIAYVPQQAWIQNATLRNNIIFGSQYDAKRYQKVVEACALKPDLEILPAGDQTEIGEKGINLSGGQKQRVSLARAVYSDTEIYFLDDPLSAVDSHVGKHIFERVIGPESILRKKTRVLVTHSITFLPNVDFIIVLKDGEISETGAYKELLQNKGAFAEFLVQHFQEAGDGDVHDDLDEIRAQLDDSNVTEDLQREFKRYISRVSESHSETEDPGVSVSTPRKRSLMQESLRRRRFSSATSDSSSNLDVELTKVGEKLIEVEKAETGEVKWKVYIHYFKNMGWPLPLAGFVALLFFEGFTVGANVWLSVWSGDTDMQSANSTNYEQKRDMYLGLYGAFGIGRAIFAALSEYLPRLGCLHAALVMHSVMSHGVLRAPLSFFDTTPLGRLLSRFSRDIDVLDNSFPSQYVESLWCVVEVAAVLIVVSYSTKEFLIVIIPIGVLYYFLQRFYISTSRQLKRIESVSRSPIYSHFAESITGAPVIRAYKVEERFRLESEAKIDFNQVSYYPSMVASRWLEVRLETLSNLIIFFASLFAVLQQDVIDPGLVGLSVSYALQVTQLLNWLVHRASEVETDMVAVERIKEYSEISQEASWESTCDKVNHNWPVEGKVEFRNYEVRYREGLDLVLKGINFSINPGEKVGIVGRTGAGKSSLTLALFRIIESAGGSILIDGVDISTLGLHALRSRLTIIPQDPVFFSGTLRFNLDPFSVYKDEDVWRALQHAHLTSFVKGLAAGLQHEVAEGGENLSVGQRQLICLARALLRKTKILILDEATAAVDLETDDLIQSTIRQEFKDCTILTIAHRLNTIMDSDRVLVLDKGMIAEFESPADLLRQKNSIFYGLAKEAGLLNH